MSGPVFLGNDPATCGHIYPVTRAGQCHGCGKAMYPTDGNGNAKTGPCDICRGVYWDTDLGGHVVPCPHCGHVGGPRLAPDYNRGEGYKMPEKTRCNCAKKRPFLAPELLDSNGQHHVDCPNAVMAWRHAKAGQVSVSAELASAADQVRAKLAAMSDEEVLRFWARLSAIPKDGT